MHIGFILTKSPLEQGFKTFMDFSKIYVDNDKVSIYLVGNGVYCARKNDPTLEVETLLKNSKVYVSGKDLKARGIGENQIIDGLDVFYQYDNMVIDIMETFNQVVSF